MLETGVARQSRQFARLADDIATLEANGGDSPPNATDGEEEEVQPIDTPVPATETGTDPPTTAGSGLRENPVQLRTPADAGGGWTVRVLGVEPDATELVLAENQFNDRPQSGRQFFVIRISATFAGPGSATLPGSVSFKAVGDSAVAYDSFQDRCGVVPDELPSAEVFEGGTVAGNICFQVLAEDVTSLVLFSDSFVTFNDEDRVYYSLR